ncbi:flavin monoamine oxidase family protein [Paenibacillus lycopersici]|uniref:Flavin monoamine oxidase family protein n=1 Tax=Paenibacillus lycopersici TaxID=2704462 RepID=A0A6C0G405_9BACL|nr:flavin monoamine oxidase family protein [Paenibacillus lycopersici]QHT63282.1 flavin monoamine oxidase family protein [Paenibacillus lycopersici]
METKETPNEWSRRQFLTTVGKIGGAAAVFSVMGTMGLFTPETMKAAEYEPPSSWDLKGTNRSGKKIVILGAGLAGLTSAYELGKAGYDCTILEARARTGGRNWSVRRGTTVTEVGGQKQVARFDDGHYLNAGCMRIPQFHVTMEYCREFGIQMEPFNNVNESAYYYNTGVGGSLSDTPVRKRAAKADAKGYISELLAKAVNQPGLDLPITPEEKEKVVAYLRSEGNLDADLFYKGSSRGGYKDEPGSRLDAGVIRDPFDMKAIINSGFASYFSSEYEYDQQMMMFHPVGGIDAIPKAFEKRLGNRIKHNMEVTEIKHVGEKVIVSYKDLISGEAKQIEGDYCICTIPLSVLKTIKHDLSPEMTTAINNTKYANAGKIGLQFKRRFWEEDDLIFGGNTLTNMDISSIYYPPTNYFAKKGLLLGYYAMGAKADKIGALSFQEREALALAQGSKIHPQYYREFESSFSVNWKTIKYNMGSWVSYSADDRKTNYPVLCRPDRRVYLAGEHISYITAWMAGAIESARSVVTDIHERVMKE